MIPTFKELQLHLLIALHELGGSATRQEAIERLSQRLNITDEELEERYENTGQKVFANTCSWAREYLKREGYLEANSLRGIWELSEKGKSIIPDLLKGNYKIKEEKEISEKIPFESFEDEADEQQEQSEIEYLKSLDPFKFERLCAKLFEKMNLENVQYTQKSSDKGIDGYGDLVFGLVKFKVVFQAKRFDSQSVGSSDVQKLAGAMQQFGAEKAVFITTSKFSRPAKEAASDLKIELIDGEKLIEILKEKGLGFRERIEHEMDKAFFENL